MELANFLVTTAVAGIGLYLTHSLRRQQRLRIAEKRLDSYRELWALMEVARPTRLKDYDGGSPLTRKEAGELYRDSTGWYYRNGNGMLLMEPTKTLYLNAKDNLGKYSIGTVEDWKSEANRVVSQLSILRTQMKLDLEIYGVSYFGKTDDEDHAFLRSANIDPARWDRPSRLKTLFGRPQPERKHQPPGLDQ